MNNQSVAHLWDTWNFLIALHDQVGQNIQASYTGGSSSSTYGTTLAEEKNIKKRPISIHPPINDWNRTPQVTSSLKDYFKQVKTEVVNKPKTSKESAMSLWYRLELLKLLIHSNFSFNIDFSLYFIITHFCSSSRDFYPVFHLNDFKLSQLNFLNILFSLLKIIYIRSLLTFSEKAITFEFLEFS